MKSKNYDEFVEKFKPKKTTDDCYTCLLYTSMQRYYFEYLFKVKLRPLMKRGEE